MHLETLERFIGTAATVLFWSKDFFQLLMHDLCYKIFGRLKEILKEKNLLKRSSFQL